MTSSFAGAKLYSAQLGARGIALTSGFVRCPEGEVGLYIDLHTHTYPNSDDSFLSPDELVEAAKGLGLDGVCITEHDHFWDPWDILSLSKKHGFLVLPGCEVNTDEGHVLVFGMERYVFGIHKIGFLRQLVERAGGVMVSAHPYRRRYLQDQAHKPDAYKSMVESARADPLFSFCDAIEVLNGRATDGETNFSLDVAGRLGLGMVGGSDSHRVSHLGNVGTRFYEKITSLDDLIFEMKAGRFEPAVLFDPEHRANTTDNPALRGAMPDAQAKKSRTHVPVTPFNQKVIGSA